MKRAILLLVILFQSFTAYSEGQPVVCIHGFMTNIRCMIPISEALCCFGSDVYLWGYPSKKRTIKQHACCLASYLQWIARCNPNQPIHFVTHSVGALILRAALNAPGCPEEAKIGRAVLIAPPNQGTSLGRRFQRNPLVQITLGYKAGKELLTYDICDILRLGSFPHAMQVLVIAGSYGNRIWFSKVNDGFLTLEETALDTPYFWRSFPYTHGGLLKAPPVIDLTCNFLEFGCEEPEPGCFQPDSEALQPSIN